MLDQLLGQVLSGKYKIESLIRLSGPGRLYKARHETMDRPVTVFVLEPEYSSNAERVAAFERHARALSRVYSDNVLTVLDFGTDRTGLRYIAFEPIDGRTLQEALSEDGVFDISGAVSIARSIAAGLDASHTKGVVHGRLSPSTVLLSDEPGAAAKIFDFTVTLGGDAPADPRYSAPELRNEWAMPDERSDVYSLGIVLFEMLAGEAPFDAAAARGETDLPPAPMSAFGQDVPPALEHLILRAVADNPEMRPQTASEFWNELGAFESLSVPPGMVAVRNNIWKTAFIVLAGIFALASVLIYATSSRRTDPMTALQPDANGQPVQPLNPATGTEEERLASMTADMISNANLTVSPDTLPGGDNYNPWASGGTPPPGGPPIGPGGQMVTVPSGGSQFMPPDCVLQPSGIYLCPVPVNANTARPTPSPRATPANANVQATPTPAATPSPTPAPVRPTPSPRVRQSPSPTPPTASAEPGGSN